MELVVDVTAGVSYIILTCNRENDILKYTDYGWCGEKIEYTCRKYYNHLVEYHINNQNPIPPV